MNGRIIQFVLAVFVSIGMIGCGGDDEGSQNYSYVEVFPDAFSSDSVYAYYIENENSVSKRYFSDNSVVWEKTFTQPSPVEIYTGYGNYETHNLQKLKIPYASDDILFAYWIESENYVLSYVDLYSSKSGDFINRVDSVMFTNGNVIEWSDKPVYYCYNNRICYDK